MTRRRLLAGVLPVALRAQPRPPNLLVIVADDHGWNDLGCYGHPVVRTPNLDRLARDGVRFTHCFTTAPLCSPGRGAVLTGLYPHVSGVMRLVQGTEAGKLSMRQELWTFAGGLKQLGYKTAAARKWHLSADGPTAHGFDHAFPSPDSYLQQSIEFLERRHERPFCLYFCPTHTHRPYRRHDDFPYTPEEAGELLPPYLKDLPQVREHYARYLSETSKMDQEIGHLLSTLERSGELDRTVVIYLTDHGSVHAPREVLALRVGDALQPRLSRSRRFRRRPGRYGSGVHHRPGSDAVVTCRRRRAGSLPGRRPLSTPKRAPSGPEALRLL